MADTAECHDILRRYVKARIPFVSVRTSERSRVLEILRDIAQQTQTPFVVHTLSQGLRDLLTDRVVNEERSLVGALDAASQNFLTRQNLTFVFTDVRDITDDTPTSRQMYDVATVAERKAGSILVITPEPVWSPLQRLGMSISLSPPTVDEMHTILNDQIEPYRPQIPIEWTDEDYRRASSILAGITKIEAENVVATLLADGAVRREDIASLSKAKDRIFSDVAGIERVPLGDDTLRIGGLDGLRTWLDRERPFLTADLRRRQMRAPRGVLLVGVPGCGKSLSAKFVANSWSLPLYRLDMASVFGQYVGQSESRFKEALASADHVAPCVLWVDEIEKGLAGASTDSTGITNRLIGQFLYWLQESPARVFVVATANDVTRLPPELLRRGRFDELFFVDLPSSEERADIIRIYMQRYLQRDDDKLVKSLAERSEGFTGADIESAMREMGKEAERSGDEKVTAEFARLCFENIIPLSRTNPEQIDLVREWGRTRAVPASIAPVSTPSPVSARRVVIP
jgi:ATPase family associated with various cellular activities (AAA)/AAA+ lid domain